MEKHMLDKSTAAPTPAPAKPMCATMQRPVSECGCPDCGSSLIDWPTPASDVVPVTRELLERAVQPLRNPLGGKNHAQRLDKRSAQEAIRALLNGGRS